MSFVVTAEIFVDAPAPRVFDCLTQVADWSHWMPPSFVPILRDGQPSLRAGDRFRVKVGGAPFASTLRVTTATRPRELAWRGGARRLLYADHRVVIDAVTENRTRVRSIETWSGALAGVLRRVVEPLASRIGDGQLAGLARASAGPN